MLISYDGLLRLVEQQVIDANLENINGASIDITLGDKILIEDVVNTGIVTNVDLMAKETPEMRPVDITGGYALHPGKFILGTSRETFNLPNNVAAEYKLKSSLARSGLQHAMAGWCDPEWNNSKLTLELHNITQKHTLILKPGMKIGQMIFWKCDPVPEGEGYATKGQYNNQETVTQSKGLR